MDEDDADMERVKSVSYRRWSVILLLALIGALAWMTLQKPASNGDAYTPAEDIAAGNTASNHAQAQDGAGMTAGGGMEVDAIGRRFNENGDLIGEPAPPAKPLPVAAAKGEVIGYAKNAQGQSTPIRAGNNGRVVPNAPGTYVAVDMWADGGPRIVSAQPQSHSAGATAPLPIDPARVQ